MKNIARLLSCLVLALTFAFSTMLQFHHHDRSGNIFIYLTGIGEIELSSHSHQHFGVRCCCHSHHNSEEAHETHGENVPQQADCPMHLDETIVVNDHIHDYSFKAPAFHLIQAIIPIIQVFDFKPEDSLTGLSFFIRDTGPSNLSGFTKGINRRGPPSFVS